MTDQTDMIKETIRNGLTIKADVDNDRDIKITLYLDDVEIDATYAYVGNYFVKE